MAKVHVAFFPRFIPPLIQSSEPSEDWFWNLPAWEALTGPRLAVPARHPAGMPVPGPTGRVPPGWRFHIH